MKTSELIGAALDWAVAVADGRSVWMGEFYEARSSGCEIQIVRYSSGPSSLKFVNSGRYAPSDDWEQGGPIIAEEKIDTMWQSGGRPYWLAETQPDHNDQSEEGPTLLIAAMRCYVASKLGDEVDVPKELK